MKPFVQKLPLGQEQSFVARTFRTPWFEVGWHQHIEYELILFTEGSGLSFVGTHVGTFDSGDVYFLGANLPHTFQKRDPDVVTSAVVIQFRPDSWGASFWEMPEMRAVSELIVLAGLGLKLRPRLANGLAPLIRELEHAGGMKRVLLLGECLHQIAEQKTYSLLSTPDAETSGKVTNSPIDRVYEYTIRHFKEKISLHQVALLVCMSIPVFCAWFKKSTQKTYIDFLNEIRIGHACTQLVRSPESVMSIGYESGYNTVANFHKQFLKITGLTPLQYRKKFLTAVG